MLSHRISTARAALSSRARRFLGARPIREAIAIAIAAAAYAGVRALTERQVATAIRNAVWILDVERATGLDWEHRLQSAILESDTAVTLANWVYIWGHWPVIAGAGIFLYVRHRRHYSTLRNAMFLSGGVGFLFFALLPVAPPRMLDGYVDTILEQSSSYRALQPPSLTNAIAAMPSLHFGWNLLVGMALFAATRDIAVRAFAVVMPVAMALSVVATANHFVLDVVVGGLLVVAAYVVVRKVSFHRERTLRELDRRPSSRHRSTRDRTPRRQRPAPIARA